MKIKKKKDVITPERYAYLHPMTKKIIDEQVVNLCLKYFKESDCNTLVKRKVYEAFPLSVGLATIDHIFRTLQIAKLRPVIQEIGTATLTTNSSSETSLH